MISPLDNVTRAASPTLWGLTPVQLHDRYWASRGVQIVRQGERSEIVGGAELFLLTDPRSLVSFRLERLVEKLYWDEPDVLCLRIHDEREHGYRERVVTDERGRFVRFERIYDGSDARLARVALTRDPVAARAWQTADSARAGWQRVRRGIPRAYRVTASVDGRVYDRAVDEDVAQFVRHLVAVWQRPDTTVRRAVPAGGSGWRDRDAEVAAGAHLVGAVWVGAGRRLEANANVIGPTVLWDDTVARPAVEDLEWAEIEPTEAYARRIQPRAQSSTSRALKRGFDVAFAAAVLLLTLPVYPAVMLAIWLEDGRPFFFGHRRETLGGREFSCWKFRSMRKDAEQIKAQLKARNQADGPQFYMEHDPRLTRIGRLLRKCNLDELPQFWNVLRGDMSVVGPRPSPRSENQYCPPWREARLSVKPGITGLWQVKRTRVSGLDFQEWIKYDIEYVERAGWWMDLSILWQTVTTILRGIIRS
jgi:lipopolysaccharide/colanic/teichoic acid biosynthesis glycosyltransferase